MRRALSLLVPYISLPMIPVTSFHRKKVALFGLGGSGLATALALQAGGAQVYAFDDEVTRVQVAQSQGISIADLHVIDWTTIDALVLSPGVPLTHPVPHWSAVLAHQFKIPIIGDIELFCRERSHLCLKAPFIAITGTNGKSTTTALIAHVLKAAGHNVQLGGNIGTAILSLDPPSPLSVHVVECSSFQIDLAPSLNPTIGVHLNLTPDHLDRHGRMEHYASIKERLVAGSDFAVIGLDDDWSERIYQRLKGQKPCLGIAKSGHPDADIFYTNQCLFKRNIYNLEQLIDLSQIPSLRGSHNGQNAAAAWGALARFGLSDQLIAKHFYSFPGLPHRMEEIACIHDVLFINDSKATNADSAEKALKTFDDIFWIVGGKAKEGGIQDLQPLLMRVKKAYLIGESSDDFAAFLTGKTDYTLCNTLDNAVKAAAHDAFEARSGVVLLSPACASYDQYKNFEQRGDHFRSLVQDLKINS